MSDVDAMHGPLLAAIREAAELTYMKCGPRGKKRSINAGAFATVILAEITDEVIAGALAAAIVQ